MASNISNRNNQIIIAGLAVVATTAALLIWYHDSENSGSKKKLASSAGRPIVSSRSVPPSTDKVPSNEDKTPVVQNKDFNPSASSNKQDEKALHSRIEELDKKGKVLFKNKQFLEAAECFTEALDLISNFQADHSSSSSLSRQIVTLTNNRSAMYEKGSMPDLALEDCKTILDMDMNHNKARTRKLRILESLKRWYDALVEVCAIQLLFMQVNRTNLRMGLPTPPPPVPQSKMEEILGNVIPEELAKYSSKLNAAERPLPSKYTIIQLLKSYSGYNAWMAKAATNGSAEELTAQITEATDAASTAERGVALSKRGRRHVYDKNYELAIVDFQEAYQLIKDNKEAIDLMPDDTYARLLEWTGMVLHWQYKLDTAFECYEKCVDVEPTNALLLVKQAGVCMDGGKQEEAVKLFDMALGLDSKCADALMHRSNLFMLQGKAAEARKDLEKCIEYSPNHVMARLRLASILAATQEPDNARSQLDVAERIEPNSSEVQSYRGELHFTQTEMEQARAQFEKAMKLEPTNPTPYVNAAMAVLNTPPAPGKMPDAQAAIELLEKALEVDPQFMAAYIQLGQLKLGTATELDSARQVIELYDRALDNCRTPEEMKELCGMRILAVAQVDAASMLKMETFSLQ